MPPSVSIIIAIDTARVIALQTRLQEAAVLDRACSIARTGQDLPWSRLRFKPHKFHSTLEIIVFFQAVPMRGGDYRKLNAGVEMICMAAEPLARLSRLGRSGSHSAAHPHSGTSSRTADTRVPPYP